MSVQKRKVHKKVAKKVGSRLKRKLAPARKRRITKKRTAKRAIINTSRMPK